MGVASTGKLDDASWGVYWGAGDSRNQLGPVRGRVHAPAKAEFYAALQAASNATNPMIIVTDSAGFYRQHNRLRRGGTPSGMSADVWRAPILHRLLSSPELCESMTSRVVKDRFREGVPKQRFASCGRPDETEKIR